MLLTKRLPCGKIFFDKIKNILPSKEGAWVGKCILFPKDSLILIYNTYTLNLNNFLFAKRPPCGKIFFGKIKNILPSKEGAGVGKCILVYKVSLILKYNTYTLNLNNLLFAKRPPCGKNFFDKIKNVLPSKEGQGWVIVFWFQKFL